MKRTKVAALFLALTMVLSLVACGENNEGQAAPPTEPDTPSVSTESGEPVAAGSGKVLIAYFAVAENSDVDAVSSASVVTVNGEAKGRIQALAEMIQAKTDGDLFSIQTAIDYPGDGEALIDYADQEQAENARPEITNHIENLDEYDTIFVGYPIWWYDIPQVFYTFFDEYDLSGKTIIPFSSHNGSRLSGTVDTIAELEPDATVVEDAFTVHEGSVANAEEDIASWLNGLGF